VPCELIIPNIVLGYHRFWEIYCRRNDGSKPVKDCS